jgi:hypothetical protein
MAEQNGFLPWYQAAASLFRRLGGQTVVEVVSEPARLDWTGNRGTQYQFLTAEA